MNEINAGEEKLSSSNNLGESFCGDYITHRIKENVIEIQASNSLVLRIHILDHDILRFRYACDGIFQDDFSYAIDPDYKALSPKFDLEDQVTHILIKTDSIICLIAKKRLGITIVDHKYVIINSDEKGFHWLKHKKFNGNIVISSKKIQKDEAFFGLGDKPVDQNLKGKRLVNWGTDEYGFNKNTDPLYKNINFFYGYQNSRAYGIFLDNSFRTYFDFGQERKDVCSFWAKGGEMNYYFIYGPEPLAVAEKYAKLTGRPEMPPLWSLGYQQCKWSYYPESMVKEIASNLRSKKIPCDAIYLDIDYMDGFRCFTWDKEKFPDPKRMVSELKKDGFKTVVIIDPGIKIDPTYPVYQEAFDKGYFCRHSDGAFAKGKVWPGDCFFPDFTNPEVREWWAGLFKELIGDIEVDGVWNDMNEPAIFEVPNKTFPDDIRHDYDGHSCSHRKGHNVYGMQMARATYEGVKRSAPDKRPLVITRSGYNGMQRFSSVWTGDNIANWEHLEIAHVQVQRLSMSGISFCGSDIGGFTESPSGELFVRWLQMALFHPFYRTHSSGDHGEQEPWSFGEKYLDISRKVINLRYRFLPLIYTAFYQYHKNGTPVLYPLIFSKEKCKESFVDRSDECIFAGQILYCPVFEKGSLIREVYLPEGNWYNFHNNFKYSGSQEHIIHAPLDELPMFVKEGSIIPLGPELQFVGERKVNTLELRVYIGSEKTSSYLYLDDNDGYAYVDGQKRYSEFIFEEQEGRYRILQKYDGTYSPEVKTFELFFIGLENTLSEVWVDGQQIKKIDQSKRDGGIKVGSDFKEIYFQ